MLSLLLVKFVWFVLKVKVDGYPVLGHGFNVLIASQHKLRFDLISSARFFQPSTSLAEQFQNWMGQRLKFGANWNKFLGKKLIWTLKIICLEGILFIICQIWWGKSQLSPYVPSDLLLLTYQCLREPSWNRTDGVQMCNILLTFQNLKWPE